MSNTLTKIVAEIIEEDNESKLNQIIIFSSDLGAHK